MDPATLTETIGSLRIHNGKDSGTSSSASLSPVEYTPEVEQVVLKERNARDYFDDTNLSFTNSIKSLPTSASKTVSQSLPPSSSVPSNIRLRSLSTHDDDDDDYDEEEEIPVRSGFVKSNGSPFRPTNSPSKSPQSQKSSTPQSLNRQSLFQGVNSHIPLINFGEDSIVGVRQRVDHAQHLETENRELRLELQQYRKYMNGKDIVGVMKELERAKTRINELERALERKSLAFEDIKQSRDSIGNELAEHQSRTNKLVGEIYDIQATYTELETAMNADRDLFLHAHTEFPDIVPENCNAEDLVGALRGVVEQNSTLTRVAGLASSLKAQHSQITTVVSEVGRKGDPATCIRELVDENNSAKQREQELVNLLHQNQESRRDLEHTIVQLEEINKESKSTNYNILRKFFAELFDVMGEEFQEHVEMELEQIVKKSQNKTTSKIPSLTGLMVKYTRKVAEMAINSKVPADQERKFLILEGQVQSLEHLMELKLDKLGADAVLRAQIRDLKRELKLVSEKRKSEWLEYQRALNRS